LQEISEPLKAETQSQFIAKRVDYFRRTSGLDTSTVTMQGIEKFEQDWSSAERRLSILPGKAVLAALRERVSAAYAVNLTDHRIVNSFELSEIPGDLVRLVEQLDLFRKSR
jgi:hypothetical protein